MSKLRESFNVQHRFFIPLYRRILTVAVCAAWTVFEVANGNVFFAALFAGAGAWCAHQFFFAFDPPPEDPPADTPTDGKPPK